MTGTLKFSLLSVLFAAAVLLLDPQLAVAGDVIIVPSTGALTITSGMVRARPGDTVMVENGKYREHVFVKNGVTLAARNRHKAIINGGGRGTVVTLGNDAVIDGFEIKNGTIGIFSKNVGVKILNCFINTNYQSGIITVRHLPEISDNIIVFNGASGIQGWDVRSTSSAIQHNTISYNGNNGLAIGGSSDIVAEYNNIAFNSRFGLKISEESGKSRIEKNNFFENLKPNASNQIPKGNYAFDPAYVSPRVAMNFKSDPKMCCRIKADDGSNLGARQENY